MIKQIYNVCVIDIGSPKRGNLGWSFIDVSDQKKYNGSDLDLLCDLIYDEVQKKGIILGFEAPLFVPIRDDILLATKGRKGEANRPWSGIAGAQVLTINLPIMIYLFQKIHEKSNKIQFFVNEIDFAARENEIMIFEALVSGKDKGDSHIEDAEIMANFCAAYAKGKMLPNSILQNEERVQYLNLAACALLQSGITDNISLLRAHSPIYKPT